MIGEQYKKGQERVWKGAKTALERGQKRVLNGIKNGILPNSRIWKGEERSRGLFPHLSGRFFAVPPLFSPVFHDFGQKGEKKGAKKWRNGKGKNAFLSRFFPIPVLYLSFPGTCLVCGLWARKPFRAEFWLSCIVVDVVHHFSFETTAITLLDRIYSPEVFSGIVRGGALFQIAIEGLFSFGSS